MTTGQKTILAVAAAVFAAYSGGTYIFSLHGPLDSLQVAYLPCASNAGFSVQA